ncbi:MAG TPA: TIGR03557 family F420-dependent LLM class oxidoreductase, partial [Candidatus Nitrosotenuis sp.]|nr:TIGR03557 family F420-dependent LLM class oxidoreductase [Candidatus Nitrosotenuis sp.]
MHKHVGYCAMFEQFHPTDMLAWCCQAEELGFGGIMASDHFQPWTPRQGHSAFVWTWLGALGTRTSLPFCTGVTPPGYRYHPAVLAQAAATVEAMFPGRFWLGLGAGEALNEHVVGGYWPEAPVRVQRLLEAIPLIQRLLRGETVRHRSEHFQMESCRLWTLPEKPPPLFVATAGPYVAFKTGELCDGLITVGAAEDKIRMLLG